MGRAVVTLVLAAVASGCVAAPIEPLAWTCSAASGIHLYFLVNADERLLLDAYATEGWDARLLDDAEGRRIEGTRPWNASVEMVSSVWQGTNSSGMPYLSFSVELIARGGSLVTAPPTSLADGLTQRVRALAGETHVEHIGELGERRCA